MTNIYDEVLQLVEQSREFPDFLESLFGDLLTPVLTNVPVVIFGSGSLGQEIADALIHSGITNISFCDNSDQVIGKEVIGLDVISPKQLANEFPQAVVVIASLRHRDAIFSQLVDMGFDRTRILCHGDDAERYYLYCMMGTQLLSLRTLIPGHEAQCAPLTVLEYLHTRRDDLDRAAEALFDEHSRGLLVTKLAVVASRGHFKLYCDFMSRFSEPYRRAGIDGWNARSEDHYYFDNDFVRLRENEVYLDVGAFDGDTVNTFIEACDREGITYGQVYAFEPDAACFLRLSNNVGSFPRVSCSPMGLWSEAGTLRFNSSGVSLHDQAGAVSPDGDLSIEVTTIDDFCREHPVSLIKMDPGGNVIPTVLRGACETISRLKPTLALGAYHGVASIFDIPLQVKQLCPDYRLALRHNSIHLCDTVLYAMAPQESRA